MQRACASKEGLLLAESNLSGGTLGDSHAVVIVSSSSGEQHRSPVNKNSHPQASHSDTAYNWIHCLDSPLPDLHIIWEVRGYFSSTIYVS